MAYPASGQSILKYWESKETSTGSVYRAGLNPSNLECAPFFHQLTFNQSASNIYFFSSIHLEYAVFRNLDGSWWVIATNLDKTQWKSEQEEVEVFPESRKITQVAVFKDTVYGLCPNKDGTLVSVVYYAKLNLFSSNLESAESSSYKKVTYGQVVSMDFIQGIAICEGNGILFMWDIVGKISFLQLTKFQSGFAQIMQISTGLGIRKFVCGFNHAIILTDTGSVYSWGNGNRGQLGHSNLLKSTKKPRQVKFFENLTCTIVDVEAGGWHNLALTSEGDCYSWGWNKNGQLGHNQPLQVISTPYPVDLGSYFDPITGIAAGSRHSMAIVKSGKVYTWGYNKFGQLGLEDFTTRQEPTEIPAATTKPVRAISAGRQSSYIYM